VFQGVRTYTIRPAGAASALTAATPSVRRSAVFDHGGKSAGI
jgi:hypothetical protein